MSDREGTRSGSDDAAAGHRDRGDDGSFARLGRRRSRQGTRVIGGLATDGAGNTLTAFHRLPESTRFDDAPLTAALVVLRRGGQVLMAFNRFRRCWELPGGMIDPGETPRRAAARELREETGQDATKLEFAGFARFLLAEPRRVEYLALYSAEAGSPRPFTPNHEIAAIQWWDGVRPLAGRVQLLDVTLARLSGRDLGP